MLTATACIGLLGLLIIGLGLWVTVTRGRTQTAGGVKDDPADPLFKAVRAHGNATEYSPILAVLYLLLAQLEPSTWMLWTMGITTASRYLHAAGMLLGPTLAAPHPLRFVGALGTYLGGLALSLAALFRAFGG